MVRSPRVEAVLRSPRGGGMSPRKRAGTPDEFKSARPQYLTSPPDSALVLRADYKRITGFYRSWWLKTRSGKRRPPIPPEEFAAAVDAKGRPGHLPGWDESKQAAPVAKLVYADVFAALEAATEQYYHDLGWGDAEATELARVLPGFTMERLSLAGNLDIGIAGILALIRASPRQLVVLELDEGGCSAEEREQVTEAWRDRGKQSKGLCWRRFGKEHGLIGSGGYGYSRADTSGDPVTCMPRHCHPLTLTPA